LLVSVQVVGDYSPTTTRTTNACESYHSRLNSLIPSPHPNIFKLIDILLGFNKETVLFDQYVRFYLLILIYYHQVMGPNESYGLVDPIILWDSMRHMVWGT